MKSIRIALLGSAVIAAPCAFAALDNYTIDLRRETRGLDIVATATPGPVAAVQVANRSSTRVRCFVDFEGGRLTPSRREAWLDGGTVATVQQRINDPEIATLDIAVSCDALSADEPIPSPNTFGQLINRGTPQGTTGLPATAPVSPAPLGTPPVPVAPRPKGTATVISPRNQ